MRISPIMNNTYMNQNMMMNIMRLSSMRKINSAADNAAGLSISQKLQTQYRGMDRVTSNLREMKDLVRIGEGGMNAITDNLQRMRELTLQASNGLYSDEERTAIQAEINQLKDSIDKVSDTSQYNKMNLLDGSFQDKFVTVNPNGAGQKVSIDAMTAQGLGVDKVDVVSKSVTDNLKFIDGALSKVGDARAKLGAIENRFDSAINNSENAYLNLLDAKTRIADMSYADIGNSINALNTSRLLNQYRFFAMTQQNNMAGSFLNYML